MRTAVYIDGFNFYYWLKPLGYRWIDLQSLVLNSISKPGIEHEIVSFKYFTARVSDTEDDREKSTRQDVYIRALEATIPTLSVHHGEFRRQQKQMPRVGRRGRVGQPIWVWHTEEKGSDVNLAVELVNDAWTNTFDLGIVVSNDSDLERAVQIARRKGKNMGILVRGDAKVNSLKRFARFSKTLNENDLKNALFPRVVSVPGKPDITIPNKWRDLEDAKNIRP